MENEMKLKCNDGITRTFKISKENEWDVLKDAECSECGENFGCHDTKILKPEFKKHVCIFHLHPPKEHFKVWNSKTNKFIMPYDLRRFYINWRGELFLDLQRQKNHLTPIYSTGQTDNNGNIYDGDIRQYGNVNYVVGVGPFVFIDTDGANHNFHGVHKIWISESRTCTTYFDCGVDNNDLRIGNKFENHELLKQ